MGAQAHFDVRSATYDDEEVHHRIVSLLLGGADIKSGSFVLDIATGTGLLALQAARQVGPQGKVIGIDTSEGMLAQSRAKAVAAELRNIGFIQADAGQLTFPAESFDLMFCSSAIVLMPDVPRALRRWFDFLKHGGIIAFDAPAKPFGISQRVAEVAARHGVRLAYADIADTPGKCRSLLEEAGFEVVDVRVELASSSPIALGEAIAFWDERIDHPAWQALKRAPPAAREAMRSEYVESVTAAAVDGYVPNDVALTFAYGRKPSCSRQRRSAPRTDA